jgi:hypothetical protein
VTLTILTDDGLVCEPPAIRHYIRASGPPIHHHHIPHTLKARGHAHHHHACTHGHLHCFYDLGGPAGENAGDGSGFAFGAGSDSGGGASSGGGGGDAGAGGGSGFGGVAFSPPFLSAPVPPVILTQVGMTGGAPPVASVALVPEASTWVLMIIGLIIMTGLRLSQFRIPK